jgi:beta-lactamase regulating signal transducer with metallopeptidase domain/HEAT repeat protein
MIELPAIELLFSGTVVERLGWVLVHSLWQFALVALLAEVAVRSMRRCSAASRYSTLLVAMTVMVGAAAATCIFLPIDTPDRSLSQAAPNPAPESAAPNVNSADKLPLPNNSVSATDSTAEGPTPELWTAGAAPQPRPTAVSTAVPDVQPTSSSLGRPDLIRRSWLAWIVAGWIVGTALCSLRPLLGWRTLRRLRRLGVSPAPDELVAALRRVSIRLGVRPAVRVMQSTLARVPVVVGYVQPLILLPVSLVTNIPIGQLEAILAHELAHVRRHDFVVNLLQTLVETLFFYHPAVWWLSRRIRIEREHCCDDIVVTSLGNRIEYGRALVAVEELRGRSAVLALAAADGSLLCRIRRILGVGADRNAFTLAGRWPAALLALAMIGATCALAMNWSCTGKDDPANSAKPGDLIATDTDDPDSRKDFRGPGMWSQRTFTTNGKIEAELPGGLKMELVGVTDIRDSNPVDETGWWKGDGTPLEKPPIVWSKFATAFPAPSDGHFFAYRIVGFTDAPSFTAPNANQSTSSWPDGECTVTVTLKHKGDLTTAKLQIGVAAEPWTTWQYDLEGKPLNDPAMGETLKELRHSFGFLRVGPHQLGDEQGVAMWEEPVESKRELSHIITVERYAIDKMGKVHSFGYMSSSGRNEFYWFDVAPADFARFEYRVRPYRHWVTFENVSLKPGHKTEVKVKVETLHDKLALLHVRNANDSPAQFNNVVSAHVGFPKSTLADWVGRPNSDGIVSLLGLPIGTHWLLAAADSEQRTPFQLKIPADQPIVEQRLRADPHWVGKNIDVKSTVQIDEKDGEVIIVDIHNKTNEALSVSEKDMEMTTPQVRGLSPNWHMAGFPAIKIEAKESGRIRLNWREWAKRGLWSVRTESIDEKGWTPAQPGKIWVRVSLGNIGSLPVSVSDPSREETGAKTDPIEKLKQSLTAENTDAGKFAVIAKAMSSESDVAIRRRVLDLAAGMPCPELESFLGSVLKSEEDAGVRIQAVTILGRTGSAKSLPVVVKVAASDRTTTIQIADLRGESSARRAAIFSVAELASRFPKLEDQAAAALRTLTIPADPKDRESLLDARLQALYQITHDEELLKPFFDRMKSSHVEERRNGVVAFRFLKLKKAPPEIVQALQDTNLDVRSWAALVLGEIGDPSTVDVLAAAARDTKLDRQVRCNAIGALGQMRAKSAADLMEKLLADPDVSTNAAIALYRITGKKTKQFPEGYNAD